MATAGARQIKLDVNGDLDYSTGTLVFLEDTEAIRQAVLTRLQFFKGEWFLFPDQGLPWFQSILIKNPNANVLNSVFRTAILGVAGVASLTKLDLTFDRGTRKLTVNFAAMTDLGATIAGTL